MFEHKSISLADQIFERLENDILIGKYPYGTVLTETALSEELGVSRTPVREALGRLQQENIIKDSSRGMVVLGITEKDMRDIYAIRTPLECMAIVNFIENMTDESLKALRDIVEIQEFYGSRQDYERVSSKDSEFHEAIYLNCGSHILAETLVPLHRKVVKYRKASIKHTGRAEKSIKEHKELYDAIAAKDVKHATDLITKHIDNAKNSILSEE